MRNIVGQVVRGDDFFRRPEDSGRIWRAIETGSHIVISAPRRVGKTSLLFHLLDHPKAPYHCVYVTTESVNDENEYFKRLLKAVLDIEWVSTTLKASHTASNVFGKMLNKLKSVSILGEWY